jgi:hypothetical protein
MSTESLTSIAVASVVHNASLVAVVPFTSAFTTTSASFKGK